MIRAPFSDELEETLGVVTKVANTLKNKIAGYKGAQKTCKTEEAKERSKRKASAASAACEEAFDQVKHLENLVRFGRDDEPYWNDDEPEHRAPDLQDEWWSRRQKELAEALEWLYSAETTDAPVDVTNRWADAKVRELRRAEILALAKVAAAVPALLAENKESARAAKRAENTIKNTKARIRMLEAQLADSGMKEKVKRLEIQLEEAQAKLRKRTKPSAELKRVRDNRDMYMLTCAARDKEIAALREENADLRLQAAEPKGPSYEIVRRENERLTAEIQRLTRENTRLEEHIDRISGRGAF